MAERGSLNPRVRTRKGAKQRILSTFRNSNGTWRAGWDDGGVPPDVVGGEWTDYKQLITLIEIYNNARAR